MALRTTAARVLAFDGKSRGTESGYDEFVRNAPRLLRGWVCVPIPAQKSSVPGPTVAEYAPRRRSLRWPVLRRYRPHPVRPRATVSIVAVTGI